MSYLLAKDTVNGAEGSVVVTRNGVNTVAAGMRNIKTNAEIQSNDMRVIGTRTIQDKPNGVKLTAKGNIYYGSNGSNLFRDMVLNYIQNGVTEYFDIQINNTDPTASQGNQIAAYYGCHLTGDIPLSILDDEQAMLSYDFNFSYTRVGMLQKFNDPTNVG